MALQLVSPELSTSFMDLILLKPNSNKNPKQKNLILTTHPQTNNHFASGPDLSENHDGCNTVYSSPQTQVCFTLTTCSSLYLLPAATSCHCRLSHKSEALLTMARSFWDECTGWPWADEQFLRHALLIAPIHICFFSWYLYKEYRGCTKLSFLLTSALSELML